MNKLLSLIACVAITASTLCAQTLVIPLQNVADAKTVELTVSTNSYVLNIAVTNSYLAGTNFFIPPKWRLLSLATRINLAAGAATNVWSISYTPSGSVSYVIGTTQAEISGTGIMQSVTTPPLDLGDLLSLTGNGGQVAATNTKVLAVFGRLR
jgi:hypothetical protein